MTDQSLFDPEMMAGLKALSEIKAEDLTPEQVLAVTNAIAAIDCTIGMLQAGMERPPEPEWTEEYEPQYTPYGETRVRTGSASAIAGRVNGGEE
jgi:hypothetical protein